MPGLILKLPRTKKAARGADEAPPARQKEDAFCVEPAANLVATGFAIAPQCPKQLKAYAAPPASRLNLRMSFQLVYISVQLVLDVSQRFFRGIPY